MNFNKPINFKKENGIFQMMQFKIKSLLTIAQNPNKKLPSYFSKLEQCQL